MRSDFIYEPKSKKALQNWYNEKVRQNKSNFSNFDEFYKWYNNQKKECYYCGLKECESQEIVKLGILKSKRFPSNGKIGRAKARGVWLEIDRRSPGDNYSKDCVLSCYFCNNDKSDVFDAKGYREFIQDRCGYLKKLLKSAC